MTQPVPTPPAPQDLPTTPAGNFTNPAFVLALIPTVSFILTTFFHGDLGLSKNAQEWSVLASGLVGLGAYLSRAVKHHSSGQVLQAWFHYLESQASVTKTEVSGAGDVNVTTTEPGVTSSVYPIAPSGQPGDEGGGSLEGVKRPVKKTTSARRSSH